MPGSSSSEIAHSTVDITWRRDFWCALTSVYGALIMLPFQNTGIDRRLRLAFAAFQSQSVAHTNGILNKMLHRTYSHTGLNLNESYNFAAFPSDAIDAVKVESNFVIGETLREKLRSIVCHYRSYLNCINLMDSTDIHYNSYIRYNN